jgi:hypothetical protein
VAEKKFPFDFMQCVEVYPNGAALRTFGDTFFTSKFAYHSASAGVDGKIEYLGYTNPGNGISSSAWAIKMFSYDASGNITDIKWSGGTLSLDKMFDDRVTYTYS